jgi:hypothetical protein
MQATFRSRFLHALSFGLCGLLGVLVTMPFTPVLIDFYVTLFVVYTGTFLCVVLLLTRGQYQQRSLLGASSQATIVPSVWLLWLFLTILWLSLLSVFVIYPALVSGVYRFPQHAIWDMTFPHMPYYMRTIHASLIAFVIIFYGSFLYYPFTFYLLAAHGMKSPLFSSSKKRERIILLTGMACTPFFLHHIIQSMITWLID